MPSQRRSCRSGLHVVWNLVWVLIWVRLPKIHHLINLEGQRREPVGSDVDFEDELKGWFPFAEPSWLAHTFTSKLRAHIRI